MTDVNEDAGPAVRYHFLDVGGLKYGECTLITAGDVRILIDGGHRKDFEGQLGYRSIPDQLADILDEPAPHSLTLLVVTHCHDDHIGCLLELVSRAVIRPRWALVTDPRLGFGREGGPAEPSDPSDAVSALAAVLREEDASDLSDADLAEFIDAVATVESRYSQMLAALETQGANVIPYTGAVLPSELSTAVRATGLTLLGPTRKQLLLCASQISATNKEATDAVDALGADAGGTTTLRLYRDLVGRGRLSDAGNGRGSAMNCQSITLAFGPPTARALIAGDMQFVDPEVRGADGEVEALRQAVVAAGPYALFKTTHHTSHNGLDADFLDALGSPRLLVHSGGVRDPSHPFPATLAMLGRRRGVSFARTDRNGRIVVQPDAAGESAIVVERGVLNDFTDNRQSDPQPLMSPILPETFALPQREATSPHERISSAPQIIIVRPGEGPIELSVAGVEIRIGPALGATGSVDRTPQPIDWVGGRFRITRDLGKLLFVTNPIRLRANIGEAEADAVLAAIAAAGGTLLCGAGDALIDLTNAALRRTAELKGLVLLGGYDVVPSVRTDAVGSELRQRLGDTVQSDADAFWVWSDRLYGDVNGDHLAEVPVSRIPDARDAGLVRAALAATPAAGLERFGVRNLARPFADQVFSDAPGAAALQVSETFLEDQVLPVHGQASNTYFMLHGRESDGRIFQGERASGPGYTTAFTVRNVPSAFSGVVVAGCCWGALVVNEKARDVLTAVPAPRSREASIALSYLAAGATAFIGCTGAHYSGPDADLDANFAGRLHQKLLQNLASGEAPSLALHRARIDFLGRTVSQGSRTPLDLARRLKNAHQFTCLGLGW